MRKKFFCLSVLVFLVGAACALTTSRPTPLETPAALPASAMPQTAFVVTSTSTPLPTATPTLTPTPSPSPTPTPLRFAVIGDFGQGDQHEADVAALVKSWQPEIVLTVGDNNYPSGSAETMDDHIGQYYSEFISPYHGSYGPGADVNRFFPTIGNHDLDSGGNQPYLDYFTLPGNERYYDFVWGPIHFFALDSDSREADGVAQSSVQAQWLQQALSAAQEPWKIVYFHQSPYSSGTHGGTDWMRWPFADWGADAILSGHDHIYERLNIDGIPYFVNGVGGGAIYAFKNVLPESQARFNDDYGAMLVTATPQSLLFQFFTRRGELVDTFTLQH